MAKYAVSVSETWIIEAESGEQAKEKWEVEHENVPVSATSLPQDWSSQDGELTFIYGDKWAELAEPDDIKKAEASNV